MTTKKKKTKQMKKKPSSPTVDRISQLPDEIIHLILQNLHSYKSVARTSILSRRWGQLWRSYPVVEVDVDHYQERIDLKKLADAISKRFRGIPLLLDSFTIRLWNTPHSREDLHQLLSSVSVLPTDDCGGGGNNRSPLMVVVEYMGFIDGGMYFNCSRTKFLQLRGCDLSGLHNLKICLDNLQELNLQQVCVSEQSFPSCLANAPRLEKLMLWMIKGIRSLEISASNFPSLKSLFVSGQTSDGLLQHVQLTSVPLLEALHVQGYDCKFVTIDSPVSAPFLKSVVRKLPRSEHSSQLDELISKFPSLESLYLDMGYIPHGTGRIRISTHMLRKLTIEQRLFGTKIEIEIDAPNLVFLYIKTEELTVTINVVNVASNCRSVVHYGVSGMRLRTSWVIELRKWLAELATQFQRLVFKLCFKSYTEVSMMDWTQLESESSPIVVQHLQLGTNLPLGPRTPNKALFLDGLLSAFHPKMLYLARRPRSNHNRNLFSYISRQVERKNLQDCCSNKKCWRHQFKDAKITSVTVDDFLTTDKSLISQPSINMIFHFE